MQIETSGSTVRITLATSEAHLLRLALERASFMDTPVSEQAQIQEFCARALEGLGAVALKGGGRL
jgi:hypothetical protein